MDTVFSVTLDGRLEQMPPPQGVDLTAMSSSYRPRLKESTDQAEPTANSETNVTNTVEVQNLEATDTARSTGDWTLYKHYIMSVGVWRFGLLVGAHLLGSALDNFPSRFLPVYLICPFG